MNELGSKGIFISPVNHPDVMAGQGTIALELLEQVYTNCVMSAHICVICEGVWSVIVSFIIQVPHLDVIIVSVGGGGMISGITVAAKVYDIYL